MPAYRGSGGTDGASRVRCAGGTAQARFALVLTCVCLEVSGRRAPKGRAQRPMCMDKMRLVGYSGPKGVRAGGVAAVVGALLCRERVHVYLFGVAATGVVLGPPRPEASRDAAAFGRVPCPMYVQALRRKC